MGKLDMGFVNEIVIIFSGLNKDIMLLVGDGIGIIQINVKEEIKIIVGDIYEYNFGNMKSFIEGNSIDMIFGGLLVIFGGGDFSIGMGVIMEINVFVVVGIVVVMVDVVGVVVEVIGIEVDLKEMVVKLKMLVVSNEIMVVKIKQMVVDIFQFKVECIMVQVVQSIVVVKLEMVKVKFGGVIVDIIGLVVNI